MQPLKIKYHEKKIKRPVRLIDLDDLNYIVAMARLVCEQPGNMYRVAHLEQVVARLEQAIKDAEEEKPCG